MFVQTRLEVELDHGRGGTKCRAGCPSSERTGGKVVGQPTVVVIFNRLSLNYFGKNGQSFMW